VGIINDVRDALRFKETIFYKEDSDLQLKYDALNRLNSEYPNNEEIKKELYIVKKGLEGENEIAYQLKKSSIGMYVLRDIKLKYEDLTAQIDYVIITPVFIYYVECKNLIGNIIINEKGDFSKEIFSNGKKTRVGIPSPLRQVEAQREVLRKIWESNTSTFKRLLASNHFDYYRRVLVVAANKDTIINTTKAPKDIKYKVLRADSLVRQIEYDLAHRDNNDYVDTKNGMEECAKSYIDISISENVDYYNYYKEKYCSSANEGELKEKLIDFRKKRSDEMNIPAYYVFTNDELESLIKVKPKTLDELKNANILLPVKIKTHGEQIITIINS